MTRIGLGRGPGLALSAAGALWLACAGGQPALAGDDGDAPIWVSIGSVFGWSKNDNDVIIDYRDQPRLVVPQKMDLPPPAAPAFANATDWPHDPDIARVKREEAEKKIRRPMLMDPSQRAANKFPPTENAVVTTNYTAGMGPPDRCRAAPGQSCDDHPGPTINWNPLTWVGLQKKPVTVLGPEPVRQSLTDPPPGYRAPVEGPGVKVDSN